MATSRKEKDPSGPYSPQDTLIRFATLVGSFKMKASDQEQSERPQSPIVPCNEALLKLLDLESEDVREDSFASFPSLALHSVSGNHPDASCDKDEVEALAASNLSRRVLVVPRQKRGDANSTSFFRNVSTEGEMAGSTEKGAKIDEHHSGRDCELELRSIAKVPHIMLENLSASFTLLLDARLRAYTKFLALHEMSLAKCPSLTEEEREEAILAVERKLATLVEMGTNTVVDAVVTSFHVQPVGDAEVLALDNTCKSHNEVVSMPLNLEATMDISIPNMTGGTDCTTATLQTPGTIKGAFDRVSEKSHLKSVTMDIDAHELLDGLIDRAGLVMSMVVERVNATVLSPIKVGAIDLPYQEPEHVLHSALSNKESTHEDMPPPEPRPPHCSHKRKRLPDRPPPVVSPDIGSLSINSDSPAPSPEPPPLHLAREDDAQDLSAERCATIVDSIIGDMDAGCFGPPAKRFELGM